MAFSAAAVLKFNSAKNPVSFISSSLPPPT
jgi:hypothetical protein